MMKRFVSLGLVVLVVAAGVWGYFYVQSRGQAQQYRLARVERGPLTAAVSATGNLNAVITVQVGSQISGQIKELLADFNTLVKKNQVIARIDPEIFDAKVTQARADVDSAQASILNQQAQVERERAAVQNARAALAEARAQTAKAQVAVVDAKRDLDRKVELARRELIARSELDSSQANHDSALAAIEAARAREQSLTAAIGSAEAQMRVAEAQLIASRAMVKQKQAALRQAQVDLEHTTIRAPVDGVVVSRQVDVGQTVAASLQAPVLFTIAQDLTKMQVETSVDEADIGRIQLDGPANFTVDAFPNETFSGRVVQIRKAAQVVQNVVTYTVVVAVDNPRGRLLPGMTANVKLVIAEKPSVLRAPNAALRFRPAAAEGGDAGGRPTPSTARSGAPPERQGAGGENLRERLVRRLDLTAEQQAQLAPILEESRRQTQALGGLAEAERQSRTQQIREATRARIRELLTPDQRARFDQMPAEGRGGGMPGRVFVIGPDGRPKAIPVVLGLTDGTATEVVGGDLQEGQEVIIGTIGGQTRPGGQSAPATPPRLRL